MHDLWLLSKLNFATDDGLRGSAFNLRHFEEIWEEL